MSQNGKMLPIDWQARQAALDTTQSFCVQAPAGSGKTELLTQRMLRLLAQVEAPEEVLAFTFTRKAAGEMRQRLIKSLREAAVTDAAAITGMSPHKQLTLNLARAVLARDEEQKWQLLRNTHRLRIMTIDSFNHSLTAQLPLSASMGGAARITEDIRPIFASAVQGLLAKLEGNDETARLLAVLLGHLQNNLREAEKLLIELLQKREQWWPLLVSIKSQGRAAHVLIADSLDVILAENLQKSAAGLRTSTHALHKLIRFSSRHLQDIPAHVNHALAQLDGLPAADSGSLALWKGITTFLLTKESEFRKKLTIKEGFPAASSTRDKDLKAEYDQAKADFTLLVNVLTEAGVLPLLQQVVLLPEARLADTTQEVLNAVVDLLPLLVVELKVAMQAAGKVDYTQTTLAAQEALGSIDDPSELALKLDYRIQHILVDEFQDTSTVQFKLLELLIGGWTPEDGRTLFVVGDGMQSCYGFRNARVELFMQVRDNGIAAVSVAPLDLNVNFRSDQSVVQAVNAIFASAFPARMDLQHGGVPYSASQARPDAQQGQGVNLDLWIRDNQTGQDNQAHHRLEAEAVADRIVALQQEDAGQSIAILVRNRRHIDAVVPVLRQRGIAFNAAEMDPLLSYPAISDLYSLLKALLNLADDVSWFALLRSPLIGLRLEDITMLAGLKQSQGSTVWTLWQDTEGVETLSEDACHRLLRSRNAIAHARKQLQRAPLRTVLEDAWEGLGGPACVPDAWLLPNIGTFLTLLEQYDEAGEFNLGGFTERLNNTWGNVLAPDINLTIQTIHKSKGLEYDAVLIPGLHRGGSRHDAPLLQWYEYVDAINHNHPILALLPGKGEDKDALYEYLKHESALRESNEATRLLYIAVTRAARSAWLFGRVNQGKDELEAPAGSLLQTIAGVINSPPSQLQLTIRTNPQDAADSTSKPAGYQAIQPMQRLPFDWQPPALPAPPETPVAVEAEEEPQHEQLLARQIGELVHLGLQMAVEYGTAWLDQDMPPPLFSARLAPLCGDNGALESAVKTVMSHLRLCLAAPEAPWLFGNTHAESACEQAVVDYREGYRRDYIIDRTFIDETGTRWIIDYKSSAPPAEGGLADFLAAETARYQPQLQAYASLFGDRPEPVRTALYFTALAHLQPL